MKITNKEKNSNLNSQKENKLDSNKPIKEQLDIIESNIIGELKDFQKATVERIDHLYRNGQNRVLVSDEVGLGKTLIARGTIAKFAKLRKEENDDLVKVVYICSNGAVAGQNLEKLRIINEVSVDNSNTSRLSMQHLNIFNQEYDGDILNNYIQLISLTPQTSFRISNREGTVDERALMFAVLKRVLSEDVLKELEKIFKVYAKKSWAGAKEWCEYQFNECNNRSKGKYEEYMVSELNKSLNKTYKEQKLIDYINSYCLSENKTRWDSRDLIVELRTIFADISLNKLEPDLIIMDEFQRFKYLINSEENSEMNRLTNKFFNNRESTRILMLSATPYKMYSTIDEIDQSQIDAHYSEFFDVMNFLNIENDKKQEFKEVWSNYSIHLKEIQNEDTTIISAKKDAEEALYNTICRTERITESKMGDIIDDQDVKENIEIFKEDIKSYLEVQKLLDNIEPNMNVPIDYIKSTPYIMSFMKNYKLKTKIEKYFEKHPNEIRKMNKKTFWLTKNKIRNYKTISNNNARLNHLMNYVFKDNSENLLWIPPSKPYYPLQGVFRNKENLSKTIIFSSWEMVPRMISGLVSYESERKTIGKIAKNNKKINYFNLTKKIKNRMRFESDKDKPRSMTLLSLVYASEFLSSCYDPIDCLNRNLTLKDIEREVKSKIREGLKEIEEKYYQKPKTNSNDNRWYYLAPLLLDSLKSKEIVDKWFEDVDDYVDKKRDDYNQFIKHINNLEEIFEEIYNGKDKLGKKPKDLIDVLCNLAIAAPANCIYRSFKKESTIDNAELRKLSIRPSRSFMKQIGNPQAIAVVELTHKSGKSYWKKLLKYSKQGDIQGVFDEYIHLLSNGLDKNNENRILIIQNKLLQSLALRSTSYDFDTYPAFSKRIETGEKTSNSLRTNFAVSFTKGKNDEKDANRKKSVRDAFNSPFRPFVLASTSIGQEGLDFHNYCRRIVHWNLPSNPIDLEQREGRINRFECLAIRQNIAKRYGNIHFENNIWKEMLYKASECEKDNECSDLIPFWGLKESKDMIKIERIVPMYPFSLDEKKYERLIKILSLYRLTLGQARQEELLEYIFDNNLENNGDLNNLFINLSPYYKDKLIVE